MPRLADAAEMHHQRRDELHPRPHTLTVVIPCDQDGQQRLHTQLDRIRQLQAALSNSRAAPGEEPQPFFVDPAAPVDASGLSVSRQDLRAKSPDMLRAEEYRSESPLRQPSPDTKPQPVRGP
eukprot:gene3160-3690_t